MSKATIVLPILLLLPLFASIVGCKRESRTASEQTVVWLNAYPFRGVANPIVLEVRDYPDYATWMEEGRRIPDVQGSLLALLRSGDERVDLAAVAYVLGRLGDQTAIPLLMSATKSNDARVRMEAAAALGTLKARDAVEVLCDRALHDDDHNVRAQAVVALGKIGDRKALPCLESAAKDRNSFVAGLAREAIPKLGVP